MRNKHAWQARFSIFKAGSVKKLYLAQRLAKNACRESNVHIIADIAAFQRTYTLARCHFAVTYMYASTNAYVI